MYSSKELRKEFNNSKFKEYVLSVQGTKCVGCGADYEHLHHIVPLSLGGTNRVSNIVPLCYECHGKAHGSLEVRRKGGKLGGRPKCSLNATREKALNDYVAGIIGSRECKERCGIKQGSHLTDMGFYNEYLNKNGIKKVRNNVDLLIKKNGYVPSGKKVSKILYKIGLEETHISMPK